MIVTIRYFKIALTYNSCKYTHNLFLIKISL